MTTQSTPKSLKDYFQPEVLDPKNPLFEVLGEDPLWWKIIREDKDLYVNIRKYNRINVYHRGASVMSLLYDGKKITAEIHNHYLGVEKSIASLLGTKYGNVKSLSPEELVSRLPLIKKRIAGNSKFKANLAETDIPLGEFDNDKDAFSEKAVQANMYLKGEYIDTEFAVRLDDGTDIRIDLVSLTNRISSSICVSPLFRIFILICLTHIKISHKVFANRTADSEFHIAYPLYPCQRIHYLIDNKSFDIPALGQLLCDLRSKIYIGGVVLYICIYLF